MDHTARSGPPGHRLPGAFATRAASRLRTHLARTATAGFAAVRRRPLRVLALLLAGIVVIPVTPVPWLIPTTALQVLPALQVCLIAATRPTRVSVPATAVTIAVQAAYAAAVDNHLPPLLRPLSVVTIVSVTIIAALTGYTIRQNHLHAEALRTQANAHAVTAERLRLARDLHDMVAHSIAVIAIQAGMADRVIATQPDEAREALQAIESTSRHTLAGLRQMLTTLRRADTAAPDDSASRSPTPGLTDLDRLVAMTRETGIRLDVRLHGDRRRLPLDVDTCAFRIIQEALTNVIRHAHARHVGVRIDYHPTDVTITVTDDGQGGPVDDTGYGIAGMRERVALLGGQFTAAPRPGGGFQVTAQLPLPVAAAPGRT